MHRSSHAVAPLLTLAIAGGLPQQQADVRDPVASLSLRQLAGQRIVVGYRGTSIPASLLARARRGEIGGVIVFASNIRSRGSLATQIRRLQRARGPLAAPLLTMIDQEGGLVKRLPGAPTGSPASMGRRGSAFVRRQGRATAANLRAAGINVNLAPVVDLGRPGSYQRRTQRAFAARPTAVSALGSAFAAGLQQGGVAATLKHFPGLGGVTRDEDALVQTVRLSRATLRGADETPFRAGMAAGARLVMTSTARYPSLSSRPALLSPAITTGELRQRLGFTGVSITDDLDVAGLRPYGGPVRLALAASAAGNDLLLFAQSADDGRRALGATVDGVRSRHLSRTGLETSVRRILALRAALP